MKSDFRLGTRELFGWLAILHQRALGFRCDVYVDRSALRVVLDECFLREVYGLQSAFESREGSVRLLALHSRIGWKPDRFYSVGRLRVRVSLCGRARRVVLPHEKSNRVFLRSGDETMRFHVFQRLSR